MHFLARLNTAILALLMVFATGVAAQEAEPTEEGNARTMAITVEALVTDVDMETRHVTLQGPRGDLFTVTVPEDATKLENIKVGAYGCGLYKEYPPKEF